MVILTIKKFSYTYEKTIEIIKEACSTINLEYSCEGDGRLTSAIKEGEYLENLIKYLKEKYPKIIVVKSRPRYWNDIVINDIHINLKITTGGTDNVFNKSSIYYTITGKLLHKNNINWNEWYEALKQSKIKINRDIQTEYHYLVVNKTTGEVLLKSILDIHTYKSNPSNILQINWNNEFKEHLYQNGSYKEKILELLSTIQFSLKKRRENEENFVSADISKLYL